MSGKALVRIDVFRLEARVAVILTDGIEGEVRLVDSSYGPLFKRLLGSPRLVAKSGGARGPGMAMDPGFEQVSWWTPESIEALLDRELPMRGLRGERVPWP